MKRMSVFSTVLCLLLASGCATTHSNEPSGTAPSASLGYVILYVEAGAVGVGEPAEKPWGRTVAYVRDNHGFLVEIGSPLP